MRRKGPRPVGFALETLADRLEPPTPLAAIQRVWPRVATNLGGASEPISERDGVLTVACDSSGFAHELSLMSELVLMRLNEELGRDAVRRLKTQATLTK